MAKERTQMVSFRAPESVIAAFEKKRASKHTAQEILRSAMRDYIEGRAHIRPEWTEEELLLAEIFVEYLRFNPTTPEGARAKDLTIEHIRSKMFRRR